MKKTAIVSLLLVLCISLCSCISTVSTVNHNLNVEANEFGILRRITVYNARTDLVILEMEGYMALTNNSTSELVVTCKTGENMYKKNYVYLNEYTLYVVEDINGTEVDPYHYKVVFYTKTPDFDVRD